MAAAVVPELHVGDITRSLHFYVNVVGFSVLYDRPAERFAYLVLGQAEIMIEQPTARRWLSAELHHPFGRGINLQIAVADAAALHARVASYGLASVLTLERHIYHRQKDAVEVEQFVVADPDGYLLRFSQVLVTHLR